MSVNALNTRKQMVKALAIMCALTIMTSCTTNEIYQEGDNICYDKCLQQGLYVSVDTDEECICGSGIE